LYDSFSIYETCHVLGELKGYQSSFIESRISELTKYFGINELLQHHYNELSSGQKQRALICASVFHDPQILIFDEVTASLDIVNAKNIMDFLKSEKDKGKAILFSTHILSEVEYLSDRILVIEKGQMMQETNYRELMSSTQKNNITDAFYHVLKKSL
jgi:sodium transport system ATP-binding protein